MEDKEKTLGQELREARLMKKYSLRDVEEVIGISNAYLSQLENDKIKNPGANILYKLANLYRSNFQLLLEKAGVIQRTDENVGKSFLGSAFRSEDLTPEEEQALAEYLAFIRFKNRK